MKGSPFYRLNYVLYSNSHVHIPTPGPQNTAASGDGAFKEVK